MQQNQTSFRGGLNLLVDDTRPTGVVEGDITSGGQKIAINQYRLGFNVRCRYDVLDPVLSSVEDPAAPRGRKQALVTFGNYIILFVQGSAYYRLNTSTGWTKIINFSMLSSAPRYWTIAVPIAETNYGRLATPANPSATYAYRTADSRAKIVSLNTSAASLSGQVPGLLVQDGVNQPQFIYLDINNNLAVTCRATKQYSDWSFVCDGDPSSATFGQVTTDQREYVPIGTYMETFQGMLFIVSPDGNTLYRSVLGRPLDFVVNVDINGQKGGDATTTSYSVGIGNITCIKQVSGALFVSAGNLLCFAVTPDLSTQAIRLFGEYTFIKQFLFVAGCITDRAIIDVIGDTTFVDVSGLRSFNSVLQLQNEGRNSVFSKTISSLFADIIQDPLKVSAALFDNYALYCVNTYYGYVIIVYDTINEVFTSLDISQISSDVAITQFAVISTEITQLYGITSDDRLIQLYAGPKFDRATVRLMSICSQDPSIEIKQEEFRCVLSQFVQDSTVTLQAFVNNILKYGPVTKNITYGTPTPPYTASPSFNDVDTQVNNLLFTTPDIGQGWKTFNVLSWTGGGRITNVKTITKDETPMNPILTQGNTQ